MFGSTLEDVRAVAVATLLQIIAQFKIFASAMLAGEFRTALEAVPTLDDLAADARAERAQATNLAGLFIGVMVASIIGIAVVIPVVNDVLAQSNVSGTTALVLGLIPLFIAVMLIVSMASPLMRRV
jgi:hypothetical protein